MIMLLAYITCKDKKEAKRISLHLLKKRLIACANIFPIKSLYRWQGRIVEDKESVIIAKTSSKKYKKVQEEVRKTHSYQIPCILRIDADANKDYQRWMNKEIK